MPIYEYSCKKCGKTIEVIQKFSDSPLKKHQGCGGTLTKLVSAAGFQFKGTGWYVTDYARKGKNGDSESKESKESKETKESSKDTTDKKESAAKADSSSKESSKKNAGKSAKSN
jgi:putative FmdB family regulatory protein